MSQDNINLENADIYLNYHIEFDVWFKSHPDKREQMLEKAEMYINNAFDLRTEAFTSPAYEHAVYEQAIFMIAFDKERHKLSREGVSIYKVEDLSFHLSPSLISPTAKMFLKKFIFRRVGEIT